MPRSLGLRGVGNVNLRGKKSKMMSCRCCDVVDLRGDYEARRVAREEMTQGVDSLVDEVEPTVVDKYTDSHDRGTWEIFSDGKGKIGIISSDFKHDVVLYVNGDFASNTSRMEYASLIAGRLNRTIPE